MDFLNINKKKLDIKNENNEIAGVDKKSKYGDTTRATKAAGGAFSTIAGPAALFIRKLLIWPKGRLISQKIKTTENLKKLKKWIKWSGLKITVTSLTPISKCLKRHYKKKKTKKD